MWWHFEIMDALIDVLLLLFALVGSIAGIGGKTWNEHLVLPDQGVSRQTPVRTIANKLGEWKKRLEPRGWVALTCLLAAFALSVTKELRVRALLREEAAEKRELRRQANQDRQQLDRMGQMLGEIRQKLANQPTPVDPRAAEEQRTLLNNARQAANEAIPIGPLLVNGIAEKSPHSDGRYFDFNAAELDKALGRPDWDKHVFLVSKSHDRGFRRAVFWRKDDAPGGARGRLLPTGKPGDWKKNETFYLVPKDYGPWNPKEQ
jgi:hypothetical protein